MDIRLGLVFLLVLGGNWACEARNLIVSDAPGSNENGKRPDMCTLCEEYANLAVEYLSDNKTQTDVMEALHSACSQLKSFEQQCITLVDYYASIFFQQLSDVEPDEFCEKVNLCQATRTTVYRPTAANSCDVCHQAVEEILLKLKDPDTKLDIIEMMLKACDTMENYARKCKTLVFEYGPIILVDAEKYLQKNDICTTFHACGEPSLVDATDESNNSDGMIRMVTSSA